MFPIGPIRVMLTNHIAQLSRPLSFSIDQISDIGSQLWSWSFPIGPIRANDIAQLTPLPFPVPASLVTFLTMAANQKVALFLLVQFRPMI